LGRPAAHEFSRHARARDAFFKMIAQIPDLQRGVGNKNMIRWFRRPIDVADLAVTDIEAIDLDFKRGFVAIGSRSFSRLFRDLLGRGLGS
jgi:hypothetical protein